jgi:hypothetical protein
VTLESACLKRFRIIQVVGGFVLGIPQALTIRQSNPEMLKRIGVTMRNMHWYSPFGVARRNASDRVVVLISPN